jgi:hypothetical protein
MGSGVLRPGAVPRHSTAAEAPLTVPRTAPPGGKNFAARRGSGSDYAHVRLLSGAKLRFSSVAVNSAGQSEARRG